MKRSWFIALALCVALCGCGDMRILEAPTEPTTAPTQSVEPTMPTVPSEDPDMFSKQDQDAAYDPDESVIVQLSGSTVTCSSPQVEIAGTTVAIKGEGTYIITGTLTDGQIIVDAGSKDELHLVLQNTSITSDRSAALYIKEAKKTVITLADGTENTLSNGSGFGPDGQVQIDAALFSRQDLTLNGTGSLTITSPAGHGIACKDHLIITGGSYEIQSAYHGMDVNDSLRIRAASFQISAGKDGFHVENVDDASLGFFYLAGGEMDITAAGDGISAGAYAQIIDGTVHIQAGGGYENGKSHDEGYGQFPGGGARPPRPRAATADTDSTSMKGIKSADHLQIAGGTFVIDAADDALHSNADMTIFGGDFEMRSGDDGLHADGTLTVSGGNMQILKCYEGLEAQHIIVSGGDIDLYATDDGLNAAGGNDGSGSGGRDEGRSPGRPNGPGESMGNGSILISGGELYVNASGDGIDANGTLTISGGYTIVVGPTRGDTATLDYDVSGIITGGTFIGTGASGMAQTFSASENQGVIAVQVGEQSADTKITLTDKNGNEIISYAPELAFGVVILSSPQIQSGETYALSVGSLTDHIQAS